MRYSRNLRLSVCSILMVGVCVCSSWGQKRPDPVKSSLTAAATTPFSEVVRDDLLNGLKIISLERADYPVVKCDLVIRGGAMFDLVGKTGMAALTQETLLAVNPQLVSELESLQSTIEWGIDWDTTWFHLEIPASNFEPVMEIFSRLLVVDNIRADAFKAAQERLLEKVKSRVPSQAERADESLQKSIFGQHPYGHGVLGTELTISGLKQGDVYDYHRRFYLANNASVVVVGNINHDRVMKAFKVLFGGWIKGQIVPATFRPPAQIAQLRLVKIEEPAAEKVELRGGVLGLKKSDPDFQVTELMARIIRGRFEKDASILPGEVEVMAVPRLLPGPFYFSASASPEKAQQFSQQLTDIFAGLTTRPVTDEELAAAKAALSAEYEAKSPETLLLEVEIYNLPRDYPTRIGSKIAAVTAADIQRTAKKLLDANAMTVVVLGSVVRN